MAVTINRTSLDYRKMLPYVVAAAATKAAFAAKDEVQRQMPQRFDRPKPFIINALAVKRATKDDPVAAVFVRPLPNGSPHPLILQEFGGPRPRGSRLSFAVPNTLGPGAFRLNQYGGTNPGAVAKLLEAKYKPAPPGGGTYGGGVFSGTLRGRSEQIAGVWRRPKRRVSKGKKGRRLLNPDEGPKLLFGYHKQEQYKPIWHYHETVEGVVRDRYAGFYREAVEQVAARFMKQTRYQARAGGAAR